MAPMIPTVVRMPPSCNPEARTKRRPCRRVRDHRSTHLSKAAAGRVPCEYSVSLEPGEDPEYVGEDERVEWSEAEFDAYEKPLDGNKVAGTPGFIQADEFPEAGPWRLLLQLDSMTVPFHVNFGDAGIGYAYISEDGRSGRFLWQCY